MIESGGHVEQETRRFDEKLQETVLERKRLMLSIINTSVNLISCLSICLKVYSNAIDDMAELPWEFRKNSMT